MKGNDSMMTLWQNGDDNVYYLGTGEHYHVTVGIIRIQPFVDGSGWIVTAWDSVDYDPDFHTFGSSGLYYTHKPSIAEAMARYASNAVLMKTEDIK